MCSSDLHEEELTTPWHAAIASAVSFTSGFMLPILAMWLSPAELRIQITVIAGLISLLITGYISATFSGGPKVIPVARNVIGGGAAMLITYVVGSFFGVRVG